MHRFTSLIREPVKRQGADQYLLLTLLSFAGSVTFTRLFLFVTGYPQIATGTLHIAHVLWGGLFLFVAALLPLLFANRWVYTAGAILAGAGVGLFIDEVGKFITQNNDYFYPLAAPIIYAFFLLVVLVYVRMRRPPNRGARAELYRALDAMEEVLEHDLDPQERAELKERLEYVISVSTSPDLTRLAKDLLEFVLYEELTIAPRRPTLWTHLANRWRKVEERWLTRGRLRAGLAGGLLALGLWALVFMFQALPLDLVRESFEELAAELVRTGQVGSPTGVSAFVLRVALESSVGVLLLVAAGLFIARREKLGVMVGSTGLLLSISMVNLLVFYFDQFSTILNASVQFTLLMIISYYRQRFLIPETAGSSG